MFKGDYKYHHDYARLASDTGFCFERHKTEFWDRNKINSIDIERIIDERDFISIERLLPTVSKFVLDPEQVQILDPSFVKTFILSQLSVQYLLYCKKYLDNSLFLSKEENKKLKEEIKELNLFVDDLKTHIATLMNEDKPLFKCNQCNKVFSSDEFLNSHIKRRHLAEIGTDQLQTEIKELKGRLNNAEKLIQKDETNDGKRVEDLQKRFENLRMEVQSELRLLQSQEKFSLKESQKRDFTTQTENAFEVEKLEQVLETKVSSSLLKIEAQMKSFWGKLNEMEQYRRQEPKPNLLDSISSDKSIPKADSPQLSETISSKIETPVQILSPIKTNHAKAVSPKIESLVQELSTVQTKTVSSKIESLVLELSPIQAKKVSPKIESESVENQKSLVLSPIQLDGFKTVSPKITKCEPRPKPLVDESTSEIQFTSPLPKPLPRKRRPKSSTVVSQDQFKTKVETEFFERLQGLGVSPDWTGLPTESFERAMQIVNHQADLSGKNYSNYAFISKRIEENVSTKLKTQTIEIKNREMYDESESESEAKMVETRGVLKNYPSIGSLTKKKVLFNLQEGGSSTSVASSVLDQTPRNRKRDVEDLSDLDFSSL